MNTSDQALDAYLTTNTGKRLAVTMTSGLRVLGTVTRPADHTATSDPDSLVLVVDETVAAGHTRRWVLDLESVAAISTAN